MVVGGYDAGLKIIPYYKIAEGFFPILADEPIIWLDTATGTFGLAWCYGINKTTGQPMFAVRDDIDVDLYPYIGFHESGHAFQNTIAWLKAKKNGTDWIDEFDIIRERYWAFREFPGTWWDGQNKAINGGGWSYYPDESFADAFAHMMLMLKPYPWYTAGEMTQNYGRPASWTIEDKTLEFMNQLANEVGDAELDAEDKAVLKQIAENTRQLFDVMNAFAKITFPALTDRLGDGRDVLTGGPDKTVSKP